MGVIFGRVSTWLDSHSTWVLALSHHAEGRTNNAAPLRRFTMQVASFDVDTTWRRMHDYVIEYEESRCAVGHEISIHAYRKDACLLLHWYNSFRSCA